MMFKQPIIAAILPLLPFSVFAQENPALVNFTGAQVKGSVILSFTLQAGVTCNGVGIQRSADGKSFSGIGDIQGVCGSPEFETAYKFTDTAPLENTNNHYRLDLGNYGYSQTLLIFYKELNVFGYSLLVNPCRFDCVLFFENPQNREVRIQLFDISGRMHIDQSVRGTSFNFGAYALPSGCFIYRLVREDYDAVTGRIISL